MQLRLTQKLTKVQKDMDASYDKFARFITEMKMDHNSGQKESDRLTEFLSTSYETPNIQHPKKMLWYIYICLHMYIYICLHMYI